MIINIAEVLFKFEQALIELRYVAHDEKTAKDRAAMLAVAAAIEAILKVLQEQA